MERDGPLMEGLKQSMSAPDSCVESEGTMQGNSVCRFGLRNIIDISITGQQKKPKLRDKNQTKRHDRQDKMPTVATEIEAELRGTFDWKN